jgi:hypothetical protein
VLYDEHQILPVSSPLTGYAGISDVCPSVPSVIGRAGVLRVLAMPLSEGEREGLQHLARTVRTVLPRLRILGRNSAVFSSQVPPKMKTRKAVEPSIGWFAEDSRNLASMAMAAVLIYAPRSDRLCPGGLQACGRVRLKTASHFHAGRPW